MLRNTQKDHLLQIVVQNRKQVSKKKQSMKLHKSATMEQNTLQAKEQLRDI
ncbi:hypothetical protein TTHERM_000898349 (macronuclear) [Tetrahymena thermophila SB210]|uniref:Uncharacterized protein n=1 Tax=Tetrahymena thermophila (strain SB210) TaxID=312017 RepID=W7X6F9_TETTS|nr:hypothetical protein TTHERM_000898349 [Tetrahymena thermophila SB210]EWS72997.1 hypothetical protein TTHERM_000898349 [Tetrahymena thermophila SB210]|eukprot:XP_012654465.1 hypothetical protein TTHERM_000898349 [Tetrahymena thermophila SB210]